VTLTVCGARVSWLDSEFVGHAFMIMSLETGHWSKEDCYGFYPRAGKLGIAGPGIIWNEISHDASRFGKIEASVVCEIDAEQRRSIIGLADKWNEAKYDLIEQNCIDFVFAAAVLAGLNVPERIDGELPLSAVRRLGAANGQ